MLSLTKSHLQEEKSANRSGIDWIVSIDQVIIVRVLGNGVVELILKLQSRAGNAKSDETVEDFRNARVETRRPRITAAHYAFRTL